MTRLLRNSLFGAALFLTACGGVTLQQVVDTIIANAKVECSVVLSATELLAALTGENASLLNLGIAALVNSICSQYNAQVAAAMKASPGPGKPLRSLW
jgi:hypothetical protein